MDESNRSSGSVVVVSPASSPIKSKGTRTISTSSTTNANTKTNANMNPNSISAATQSLQLLLREDMLLTKHELHLKQNSEEHSFAYAAALLKEEEDQASSSLSTTATATFGTSSSSGDIQRRATFALEEVDRKLALVHSLAERVSRTSPEAVAGPLLKLHGYHNVLMEQSNNHDQQHQQDDDQDQQLQHDVEKTNQYDYSNQNPNTLATTRDRCHRLQRQSEVLEGVAKRVQHSLQRHLRRMETATSRLERVLRLSATLKMILRLQFESSKLRGYDLEDLRDLTRAAASVAVMEDLLQQIAGDDQQNAEPEPLVVQAMRPEAERISSQVRTAAAALLQEHQHATTATNTTSTANSVLQLGATLQVYYHLGELPDAAWSAVEFGLQQAQVASVQFWSPSAIQLLTEQAQQQAKSSGSSSSSSSSSGKMTESAYQRNLYKKFRQIRAEAAGGWSTALSGASLRVWNLQRVLQRKSDPVSRQVFLEVVAAAPIPPKLAVGEAPDTNTNAADFSVFSVFWQKLCHDLGATLEQLLKDHPRVSGDVAALYPAVRSSLIHMLGALQDMMYAGTSGFSGLEDATSTSTGILGGSAALDDALLWNTNVGGTTGGNETAASGSSTKNSNEMNNLTSADTWTRTDTTRHDSGGDDDQFGLSAASSTTTSLSAIFQSKEWHSLQSTGLYPLQQAFLESCRTRLCAPIQFMFPEGVSVDEDGVAMSVLPALPSRYDLQKMEQNIRSELSLADPREGGGDLSMTSMIAQVVVEMVELFCARAKTAVTEIGEEGCLTEDGGPTANLIHDLKVANVMNTLANTLKNAPENAFIAPYRPATSPQHEEAANLCQAALLPALIEIEKTVKNLILSPLYRALNRRIATAIARVHHGAYIDGAIDADAGSSFVQKHLSALYENIAEQHLSKLPPDYASIVAASVASFSIHTFVSNVSLVRPLGEAARLQITQDLADFELALEQLVIKTGSSMSLRQVEHGKPYAELRAVRQMLFWTGLTDNPSVSLSVLSKSILREVWVKDVRPSTIFHYLFSFAPPLLSSPHHSKRMKPEEYVSTLVKLDGSTDDGEANAWMVTLACCETYQQRETIGGENASGDRRVAALLMMLGPELLRQRRS